MTLPKFSHGQSGRSDSARAKNAGNKRLAKRSFCINKHKCDAGQWQQIIISIEPKLLLADAFPPLLITVSIACDALNDQALAAWQSASVNYGIAGLDRGLSIPNCSTGR